MAGNSDTDEIKKVLTLTPNITQRGLEVGKSATIYCYLNDVQTDPDNFIWEVSDEELATVEEGIITIKSVGFVTVTATYRKDKSVMSQTYITGVAKEASAASFSLNSTSRTMSVGETYQLEAIFYDENKKEITSGSSDISWSSSNYEIVMVSTDGQITVVGVGTAKIQAQVLGLGTQTCTISVPRKAAPSINKLTQSRRGIKITWKEKSSAKGYILERKVKGEKKYETIFEGDEVFSYEDVEGKEKEKYRA